MCGWAQCPALPVRTSISGVREICPCHKYVANVFYGCDETTVSCTHRRRLTMAGNEMSIELQLMKGQEAVMMLEVYGRMATTPSGLIGR